MSVETGNDLYTNVLIDVYFVRETIDVSLGISHIKWNDLSGIEISGADR